MKKKLKLIAEHIKDSILLLRFFSFIIAKRSRTIPLTSQKNSKGIDILGNGPSLKQYIEQGPRKDRDTLCVNFSPLTTEFFIIRPKYLVLIDPFFFDENNEKVNALRETLTKKIDWKLTIVTFQVLLKKAEALYANINSDFIGLPNIYYNPTTKFFTRVKHKLFKLGFTLPRAQNVAIASIFFAINSGYESIYLYGLEHSWLNNTIVTDENVVCLKDSHYYGSKTIPWGHDENGATWKMSKVLYLLHLMFKGYDELSLYADYLDVTIINKTNNSWIDAFEKDYH